MIHIQVWWLPAYWFAKTLLLVWCMAPPPYRFQLSIIVIVNAIIVIVILIGITNIITVNFKKIMYFQILQWLGGALQQNDKASLHQVEQIGMKLFCKTSFLGNHDILYDKTLYYIFANSATMEK